VSGAGSQFARLEDDRLGLGQLPSLFECAPQPVAGVDSKVGKNMAVSLVPDAPKLGNGFVDAARLSQADPDLERGPEVRLQIEAARRERSRLGRLEKRHVVALLHR